MQTAIVIGLVAICAILLTRTMLRKAGIGLAKPDCGCGHCADKGKEGL